MRASFLVFVLSSALFTSASAQEQKWFFNTMVSGKKLALRPGEACRPWNYDETFLKEKCVFEGESYRCTAVDGIFLATPFTSKDDCEDSLSNTQRVANRVSRR